MRLGNRKNRVNPTTLSDVELIKTLLNPSTNGRDAHKIRMTLQRRTADRARS